MPSRPSFIFLKNAVFVSGLFVLGVAALPAPARAGFEWVAPNNAAVLSGPGAPVAPVTAAPPSAATTGPEVITPAIIGGAGNGPAPEANSSVMTTVETPAIVSAEQGPAPAPVIISGSSGAPATLSSGIVRGFAKNVPLAVALRQILPAGYSFSIDPDVDLGVLVSFEGGRPWRDTLTDALAPAGLVMREQGQMVAIGRIGSQAANPANSSVMTSRNAMRPLSAGVTSIAQAPVIVSNPVSSVPAVQKWQAERGDSLRKVLESWCRQANVELDWLAEYDYPLQASISYTGNFENAVRDLLTGFSDAHPQPVAELHANSRLSEKVLVIQVRGNSGGD